MLMFSPEVRDVMTSVSRESLDRYNWQPEVFSIDIRGHFPVHCT